MTSVLKKLTVLLWKCIILRKKNWILTIFEFISPIIVVSLVYFLNKAIVEIAPSSKENMNFEYVRTNHSHSNYMSISSFERQNNSQVNINKCIYIAYAPNTTLTDELMRSYKTAMESSDPNQKLRMEVKRSEADLEAALRENFLPNYNYCWVIGVLFSDINMTFKYKIIENFDDVLGKSRSPDTSLMLLKLQVYLDAQYLNSVGVSNKDTQFLIGEFLQNKNRSDKSGLLIKKLVILVWLYVCLTLAYIFLVTAVVRDTIQEKSSGIKELMRIMGLSSWMIWIHWFIYSMFVQIPVTVIVTVLLTVVGPPVFDANIFIVWILFLLVTIDLVVIFFFVSCFFGRAIKGTVFCVLGWIIISFALLYIIVPDKDMSYPLQVLISLIPLINLTWALLSLDSFSWNNKGWGLGLLFSEGYTGSHISVGLAIIIMICEIILFTLLLAYIDAVKPGRYGVAKPATFIFGCCIKLFQKDKYTANSQTSILPSNFELPPPGIKVGIRIRDLRKDFGVFKKVTAVESVNLDIYEGEVTVLLGHNGAGKTTTMSMITGMFSPTSGTVTVNNQNIYENLYNFRQNLGLCTQHNLYFPKLTVMEHLVFFGMLKGRSRSQAREEGMYLLYMLNLVDKKNLRGSKLSGGMLRRLCLAVALTGGPKVLILDEPTSGLDPENRRHIWDIILSLRGERTILITTHYMEEADILGDRIAIMDHGKVVCCGTTMFLKKLYGTGYNIHVTKNARASLIDITQTVQRHISQLKTKVVSPTQVDYSIKGEFVERFPDLFSTLESSMSSLGVTAIAVSCTTMEDVFLRVAELSEEQDKDHGEPNRSNVVRRDYNKVEGGALVVLRLEALIMKRALYLYKHIISIIIKFIIACLFILTAILLANHYKSENNGESKNVNQMNLHLTPNPDSIYPIIYDESNKNIAKIAQNINNNRNSQAFIMQSGNSSQLDMIPYQPRNKLLTGLSHSNKPSNRAFLASSFTINDFLMQYELVLNHFSASKAANLMANVLLKRIHPDRSIEVLSYSLRSKQNKCDFHLYINFVCTIFFFTAFIPFALTLVVADFIPLIVEERVTGFKYQQIIAGISSWIYRISSFICDFGLYTLFIIISLVVILIAGSDVIPFGSENMTMLFLVLILYGVSSIIFLYAFTFLSNNSTTLSGFYISLNLFFALMCPVSLLIMYHHSFFIQIIVTLVFSLHPTAAAFFALYSIATGIANESVCFSSEIHFLSFPNDSNRHSIFIYVLFLIIDIILYTIVTLIIDGKILTRIMYKRSAIYDCQGGDNDVKYETQRVRMFKEAQVDTTPLRVEGLVKNYRSFRAANQVSFLVTRGECFGLLGVNGAGKTTTFKMLTGEINPSSGDAFSTKYSVVSHTHKYLSNIGYCPQFDALLDDFTGNNVLTIIAKIKGVPRSEVRNQVNYWMTTLGIEEHANKRTKTYSGGTKRKLSTAMAFIGEPIVALLDEPTTGVDPAARRKVWDAVKDRQSSGYSAVLSSHSMEECEALCTRLTIMRRGELCCIGSVQQLKTKFGQGYVVLLKLSVMEDNQTQLEPLKKEFQRIFPKSLVQDQNVNMINYRVLDGKIPLSRLFSEVIRLKKKYKIVEDFIVSNATLEQLFLMIARGQDIRNSETSPTKTSTTSI